MRRRETGADKAAIYPHETALEQVESTPERDLNRETLSQGGVAKGLFV